MIIAVTPELALQHDSAALAAALAVTQASLNWAHRLPLTHSFVSLVP